MTLRLVPDDEDDSLAANPESPRGDLGYGVTTEPRQARRPSGGEKHWKFVEADGPAREAGPVGGPNVCAERPRGCGQPAPVLHADPRSSHPQRVLCSRCCGDAMRDRTDGGRQ